VALDDVVAFGVRRSLKVRYPSITRNSFICHCRHASLTPLNSV